MILFLLKLVIVSNFNFFRMNMTDKLNTPIWSVNFAAIGYIRNGFKQKFGVPRQSGIVEEVCSRVILNKKFSNPDSVRGIEDFSHIWLIWGFSLSSRADGDWIPLVRPPRLKGKKVGVFASRAPIRPNPIGLSCVHILDIQIHNSCVSLLVQGADLVDKTPIIDIKPYIPSDCKSDAKYGYLDTVPKATLTVMDPRQELTKIQDEVTANILIKLIEQDPRPHYHHDPTRKYGFCYNNFEVKFRVNEYEAEILSISRI